MFRLRYAVKFGAFRVCPKCNRPRSPLDQGKHVDRFAGARNKKEPMSAFEEYKDELERYEQMFGRDRGRLAVSLDCLTNAMVLVGQHGVYCTSQRNPAVPAMDIRIITQELAHAKELLQSVMEELRRAKEASAQ
jgi:hypothetical protein